MTNVENALAHAAPMLPDARYCNAHTRDGGLCERPAGWGTDHPGSGRCKLHGGSSLRGPDHPQFKHGRRSRYHPALKAQLADAYEKLADDDAFDIADELRLQRALLLEYMESKDTLSAADRQQLMAWSDQIAKTAERMTRMRNDTALTAAELKLIAARLADVVARHIADADQQSRFLADLFSAIGMHAP